jgi:predicted Rdx family selenoprotein
LAAEILKEYSAQVEFIEKSGGIFDVVRDGEVIFSKFEVGRFPEPEEINRIFRETTR